MILITRGENNDVVLTLWEKTTLTTPFYLFCFESIQENREVYFIASDISTQIFRYNRFVIEENDVPDPLNGVVTLDPVGFWTYTIYEQTNGTNLDPTDAAVAGIVETGRVKVIGDSQQYTSHTVADNTFVAHEPA